MQETPDQRARVLAQAMSEALNGLFWLRFDGRVADDAKAAWTPAALCRSLRSLAALAPGNATPQFAELVARLEALEGLERGVPPDVAELCEKVLCGMLGVSPDELGEWAAKVRASQGF